MLNIEEAPREMLLETAFLQRKIRDKRRIRVDFVTALAVLGDSFTILGGLALAFWVRFGSGWITFGVPSQTHNIYDYAGLMGVGLTFLLLAFVHLEIYNPSNFLRFQRSARLIFKACSFWFFCFLGASLALKFQPSISRIFAFFAYFICLAALLGWRWIFHYLVHSASIAKALRQRVLFVGWHPEATRLALAIQNDRSHPYEIVGCIPVLEAHKPQLGVPILGEYNQLINILKSQRPDIVLLADMNMPPEGVIKLNNECGKHFVHFKKIPSYFQILISGLHLETISGVPVLGVSQLPLDRLFNRAFKRAVDIIGAFIGLFLSAPVMFFSGIFIYLESPGPIFFSQERMGKNGRRFKMYKIRSMKIGAEREDHLNQSTLRNDPRLLKIGGAMRRWNLDEVPQFWNVLKGDMSLVGPRPERSYHSTKLSEAVMHYNARYGSKPGMTGWAQINGFRGNTSLEDRVKCDLYYLENWSLLMDLQIMFQTFLKRENAY